MSILESLTLLISVIYAAGISAYMIYREKMTGAGVLDYFAGLFPRYYHRIKFQHSHQKPNYGRWRILKFAAFNLVGNTIITIYTLAVLLQIQPAYNLSFWVLTPLLFFLICLTFYGMGIYMTAIIIEAYTKVQLHRVYAFRIQLRGVSLFHGAVSHFFICAGWIAVIAVLGLIDLLSGRGQVVQNPILVVVSGGCFALVSAFGQIVNRTAVVQLVAATVTYLLFFAVLALFPASLSLHPMTIFAMSVLFFYTFLLLVFVLARQARLRRIIHSE